MLAGLVVILALVVLMAVIARVVWRGFFRDYFVSAMERRAGTDKVYDPRTHTWRMRDRRGTATTKPSPHDDAS